MRRVIRLLLISGLLLTGCAGQQPPVIPTVARLPTVTPLPVDPATPAPPTASPLPAARITEQFFTPTPAEETGESDESLPPTPTPDILPADSAGKATPAPCSAAALEARLNALDRVALSAEHEVYLARLRTAAREVGGWRLVDETDPLAGTFSADALPLGSLRYQRGDAEALILVTAMVGDLLDYYSECIAEEAYLRQGDISERATVTIEPLQIGRRAIRATIAEPVIDLSVTPAAGEVSTPTGEVTMTTQYLVLTEDALIQLLIIPALDQALGRPSLSAEEAEALLVALVEAAKGV
ncbi:MAG: hypothetical protein HPY64_09120 [Anaerolineae bacterium]|nr:hypothetical protein [Anaerolineae bacterium]